MSYKKLLLSIFTEAKTKNSHHSRIDSVVLKNIKILSDNCFSQKGVYTVFVTLAIYKIIHPKQDIRNHQTQIPDGFSGRSIDTKYITPTLKELSLPSMAESGWLTRSLEQPYPYTLNYVGKISNKIVKKSFLELIDAIETQGVNPKYILVELLKQIIAAQNKNKIIIKPLKNPEELTILKIIDVLKFQFEYNYSTSGGSKLPVIAFYAMYQIIINEISRYNNCMLKELGSHTASDRTSKSSGDIEIFKKGELFESIEIKLDKKIDANMLRIAKEKIIKFNPKRYYILSFYPIKKDEIDTIKSIIKLVKDIHGCQIIINGIIPTLKYYMRLISNLEEFLTLYSDMIQNDLELKAIHKRVFNKLVSEL